VPPPSRIFAEYVELWGTGDLIRHVVVTLVRVAVGFGLGAAAATVLGALAGYSSLTRRLIDPTLQGLRAVPSMA
jgi:sulfonate transport system permease protein